jgi:hypothetical protein
LEDLVIALFEVGERSPRGGARALESPCLEYLPLEDAHLAGVDVDGAGLAAFVADGAMVGDLLEAFEDVEGGGTAPLRVVEKGFDY